MIFGFVIWSIVFLVLLGIGIWAWKSEKAVGFYTGTKPPEVTDVRKYNRSIAVLWFAYAGLFELFKPSVPFPEAERCWLSLGHSGCGCNYDRADDCLQSDTPQV